MEDGGGDVLIDASAGNKNALRAVERAPKLIGRLRLHWTAFNELATERSLGMSIGPIPMSAIYWYADDILELDNRQKEAFAYIMRRADNHYLGIQSERVKRQSKK